MRMEEIQQAYEQLKEEYQQLEKMFENMSLGYEEALKLYDRAEEASRMKTDFIQQMSHEIRTPLNILSGFTQLLTTPGMELGDAEKAEISKGIMDNTERITQLVNKMLELAEANSEADIERSDEVLAVQIAAQAAEDSGITQASHVIFDMQFGEGTDCAMLKTNLQSATRALTLLLDNARKFTRPAEAFAATQGTTKQESVILRLALRPTEFSFVVEDTGIGIPPEEAEHIFGEFVQLDEYYDGTGIGLTVARSLAQRLGGNITLDTSYTGGARFELTLPLKS